MPTTFRIAVAVPHVSLASVVRNAEAHLSLIRTAHDRQADLVLFPELSLTGATCGDLFFQDPLTEAVRTALHDLAHRMPEGIAAVIGAPIDTRDGRFNAALLLTRDQVRPIGFGREDRWFSGVSRDGRIFDVHGVSCAVAVGVNAAAPDAEVVLHMEALPERAGQWANHREGFLHQSRTCAVAYASAGWGESTSDGVYAGHGLIACLGESLAENTRFIDEDYLLVADIDLDALRTRRLAPPLPEDPALPYRDPPVPREPFLPVDSARHDTYCREIFEMQGHALARRMKITGGKVVVGISGGLDSTLALLAACRAADILRLPRTNILGVTMPCFGTTDHTYQSALDLMAALGVTAREVPIHQSVRQHFRDIGHDESIHDVTYENAQARERTQVLMDLSNQFGGIVLGTGDMSEMALGWCTYNGDHMSMYGVNAGIPKTVVRRVVRTVSGMEGFNGARAVLARILDTPISPELLPPDEAGRIAQQTEDLIGPYLLHDFFLYHFLQPMGQSPRRIYSLACEAFRGEFDQSTVKKWLVSFYRRFFTQQFKRNCMPDGVQVLRESLSPRGAWQMPSDALAEVWMQECDGL